MARMTAYEARDELSLCKAKGDYHALHRDAVEMLLGSAIKHGYRKGKYANGSRARGWHAYLTRMAARDD